MLVTDNLKHLCHEYAALDVRRTALDVRMQVDTADALWSDMEQLLQQQSDLVEKIIETEASAPAELPLKALVLRTLLQSERDNPTEADLARRLALSLVLDIQALIDMK